MALESTREVIRRLTVRARAEGFDEAASKLSKLAAAQDRVRVASDATAKSTGGIDRAYTRALHAADPLAKSLSSYEKIQKTVNSAQAKGVGTTHEYASILGAAERRVIAAAQGNTALAASYGRVNVAMSALAPALSRLGLGGTVGLIGGGAFAGIAAGIGAIVAGTAGIANAGDQWEIYGNRLRAAGEAQGTVNKRIDELADIASRSRGALGPVVELYAGMRKATEDLLRPQSEVARVTETITKAFSLSGQSAASTSGAILQLNQAFAAGALRGDELNSVLEGAPPIARLIAKEFGVGVGQLKALAEQGKLTADRVFSAIMKGGVEIDALFAKTNPTIEQSFNVLSNSAAQFGAELNKTLGLSSGFTSFLDNVAKGADIVTEALKRAREEAARMPTPQLNPGAMNAGPPRSAAQNDPAARFGGAIPDRSLTSGPRAMGTDASTRLAVAGAIDAEAAAMARAETTTLALAKATQDLVLANKLLVQEAGGPLAAAMSKAYAAHQARIEQYERLSAAGVEFAEVNRLVAESEKVLESALKQAIDQHDEYAKAQKDAAKSAKEMLLSQDDQIALLELETDTIGMNVEERAVLLARMQAEIEVRRLNEAGLHKEAEAYLKNAEAIARATAQRNVAEAAADRASSASPSRASGGGGGGGGDFGGGGEEDTGDRWAREDSERHSRENASQFTISGPEGTVPQYSYGGSLGTTLMITWIESAEHIAQRMQEAAEAAQTIEENVRSAAEERMSRDFSLYGNLLSQQINALRERRGNLESGGGGGTRAAPYLDPYSFKNPTRFYNPGAGGHFGGPESVIEGAISSASTAQIAAIDAQIAQLEAQASQLDRLAMLSSAGVELSEQELAELQSINDGIRASATAQDLSDLVRIIAASNQRIDDALSATISEANASVSSPPDTGGTSEGYGAGGDSAELAASYGSGVMPAQQTGTGSYNIVGYASGGEFDVDGPRGIDTPRLIGLAGGEHVSVTPANSNRLSAGKQVTQHNTFVMNGQKDEARRSAGEFQREARRQANRLARR